MSGPWSIGYVFSQEMVRLSNLDRARAIGMVQSGTLWHDVALTFGVNKSTITRLMTRYIHTGDVKDRVKNGCPRKKPIKRHALVIGHLRDQLGRAVRVRLTPNHNLGHLRQFPHEELARIPQQSITTLVGSMRKRLAECIASRGGPTHY